LIVKEIEMTPLGTSLNFFLMICLLASEQGKELITPAQAIEAVRAFEGTPTLALVEPRLEELPAGAVTRYSYFFRLPDGTGYFVDASSGLVYGAVYGSRGSQKSAEDIRRSAIPEEKARSSAESFVETHYPMAQQYPWRIRQSDFDGRAYHFEFRQRLPQTGMWTTNTCHITVDADTGEVTFYKAHHETIDPATDRGIKIPQEQALQLAPTAVDGEALEVGPALLIAGKANRNWAVSVTAVAPDGRTRRFVVTVDADTGEARREYEVGTPITRNPLRGRLMVAGIMLKEEAKPLFERRQAFVYEAVFQALGAEVQRGQDRLTLRGEDVAEVPITDTLEHQRHLFFPASLLLKLFPKFVRLVDVNEDRGAVNVICSEENGALWLAVHRGINLPQEQLDNSRREEVVRRLRDIGLVEEETRKTPSHVGFALWAVGALGVALIVLTPLAWRVYHWPKGER